MALQIPRPDLLSFFSGFSHQPNQKKCSQAGRGSYIKSVSAQLALCLLPGMEDCLSKSNQNSVFNLGEVSLPLMYPVSAEYNINIK